ncbi:MAG: hypothetical protein E6J41_25300 [Chloroflexi bacterium]|nr:MAG: hypothetical protein E6J41_25300 [Chloroflexota bacterium]
MSKASVIRWLEAVERATAWELFDTRQLPPFPRWAQTAIGATFLVLGIASLIGVLWGGRS